MESGRPGGSQPRGRSGSKALPATRSRHPCPAMYDCLAFKKVSRLLLGTAQGTGVLEAVASPDAPLSHRPTSTHRSFPLQRKKISRKRRGNSCHCAFPSPSSLPRDPAGVWEVALRGHPLWRAFTSALPCGGESQTQRGCEFGPCIRSGLHSRRSCSQHPTQLFLI